MTIELLDHDATMLDSEPLYKCLPWKSYVSIVFMHPGHLLNKANLFKNNQCHCVNRVLIKEQRYLLALGYKEYEAMTMGILCINKARKWASIL